MDIMKTLAYAGLGLAKQTNDKIQSQFDELVEAGKKADSEGKNIVGDFFSTVDSTKEDLENQIEKNKDKLFETFPFLKELEEKLNNASNDFKETVKDTVAKAKDKITNISKTEDAEIVEESK